MGPESQKSQDLKSEDIHVPDPSSTRNGQDEFRNSMISAARGQQIETSTNIFLNHRSLPRRPLSNNRVVRRSLKAHHQTNLSMNFIICNQSGVLED